MPKYRRIPVIVEAMKLTRTITIDTPEGKKTGHPGDFLITHSNGEQYPCEERTFEKLYEPMREPFQVKAMFKKAFRKLKFKTKQMYYESNQK